MYKQITGYDSFLTTCFFLTTIFLPQKEEEENFHGTTTTTTANAVTSRNNSNLTFSNSTTTTTSPATNVFPFDKKCCRRGVTIILRDNLSRRIMLYTVVRWIPLYRIFPDSPLYNMFCIALVLLLQCLFGSCGYTFKGKRKKHALFSHFSFPPSSHLIIINIEVIGDSEKKLKNCFPASVSYIFERFIFCLCSLAFFHEYWFKLMNWKDILWWWWRRVSQGKSIQLLAHSLWEWSEKSTNMEGNLIKGGK